MEPLVSVICITRNHERFCIEALDSILNQTYKNLEWIILDAASNDNTSQIIDNWLVENNVGAIFIKESELKPITVNLNNALKFANGLYVQFISLDDVLIPNKFEVQVDYFSKIDSVYLAIFSDMEVINDKSQIIFKSYLRKYFPVIELKENNYYSRLLETNFIAAPTMLYKTLELRRIGGFDERLAYEDYDMNLRMAKRHQLYFLNQKLIKYRIHDSNLTKEWQNRTMEMIFSDALIYYKQIKYEKLTPHELLICKNKFILNFKKLMKIKDENHTYYFLPFIFFHFSNKFKLVTLLILIFRFKSYRINKICENLLKN